MDMIAPEVTALRDACRALIEQAAIVKDTVLDHRADMWCVVPSFDIPEDPNALELIEPSAEAWHRVADELTDIWMDSGRTPQNHGVLVCNLTTVLEPIAELNRRKAEVKEASRVLKSTLFKNRELEENAGADEAFLESLALANAEFLSKGRDHNFHRILRSLQLPSLNFTRAQKQIRVLPDSVSRIAYTWNKTQYRKRAIGRDTLNALSSHYARIGNDLRGAEIRDGLDSNQIHSETRLFRLVHTPPTLRANVKWWDSSCNQYQWSHYLATGILVVPQAERPAIRWKPAPTSAEVARAKANWLKKANLKAVKLATRLELYRNAR